MASLTGNSIASTYTGLLKTADNSTIGATAKNVTDGTGNATALNLSTNSVVITGSLALTGSLNVNNSVTLDLTEYTDDIAAAAGGVPIGGLYRNGNVVSIRLS